MLITKHDMLRKIDELYDQVDELERSNKEFRRYISNGGERLSEVETMLLRVGKQRVFKETTGMLHAAYIKDGEPQPFDTWLNGAIRNLPDWMSRNEFIAIFNDELRELYETDVENARSREGESE